MLTRRKLLYILEHKYGFNHIEAQSCIADMTHDNAYRLEDIDLILKDYGSGKLKVIWMQLLENRKMIY